MALIAIRTTKYSALLNGPEAESSGKGATGITVASEVISRVAHPKPKNMLARIGSR